MSNLLFHNLNFSEVHIEWSNNLRQILALFSQGIFSYMYLCLRFDVKDGQSCLIKSSTP